MIGRVRLPPAAAGMVAGRLDTFDSMALASAIQLAQAAGRSVPVAIAWRTRQFWFLWAVLCLNVSAGIGMLGMASPMIQEMFKDRVTAVGGRRLCRPAQPLQHRRPDLLGVAVGRDRAGDVTYAIFFVLGTVLYASVPVAGAAGALGLFVAIFCVVVDDVRRRVRDDSGVPRGSVRHGAGRRDPRPAADRVVDGRRAGPGARQLHPRIPDRARRAARRRPTPSRCTCWRRCWSSGSLQPRGAPGRRIALHAGAACRQPAGRVRTRAAGRD